MSSYLETSKAIANRTGGVQSAVLGRILIAKLLSGLSAFEYGLYGLQDKPLSSVTQYMTKKQTTALLRRVNHAHHRPLVDDKLEFHRRCRNAGVPSAAVIAVLNRRGRSDGAEPAYAGFAALAMDFLHHPAIDLILKPRTDSLGTGIRFVSFRDGLAFDLDNKPIAIDAFSADLAADMQRDDYLVQPFVEPHPEIMALGTGHALGTLRMLSFADDREVRILYALLRIPAAGNVHDNFSSGANGNLIARVDLQDGRLSAAWGRRKNSPFRLLQRFECNPFTNASIEGVLVPYWKEVDALVTRAAALFPELPCLAWDVAVTPDGPLLIEANANADIIGAQVCYGRGAKVLLAPVIARYS
ncbi:MAG: hypothetical protein IT532_15105 [Burkholderiales bacterium]|nr:hypothetical protein [Burkholderiales bacterium]